MALIETIAYDEMRVALGWGMMMSGGTAPPAPAMPKAPAPPKANTKAAPAAKEAPTAKKVAPAKKVRQKGPLTSRLQQCAV